MQNTYDVIWTNTAENDLLEIIEYIALDSPENVIKILKKIKKQVSALNASPERCRTVPELMEQGITQYREMSIPPWRVMFRILDIKVFVVTVLDSRQNVEDILLNRLTKKL
jgi:toxin ParE1/3/4